MQVKYGMVYNSQTDLSSDYIIFKKNDRPVKSMIPVSYFWLQHYLFENEAFKYAEVWDDYWFHLISEQDLPVNRNPQNNIYREYFELLSLDDVTLKENIHHLGSFVEHYHHNRNMKSELERIQASIFTYLTTDEVYVETIGKFLRELTKKKIYIKNEDYLKIVFTEYLEVFEPYITLRY